MPQSAKVCAECGKVREARTDVEHRDGGARATKRKATQIIAEQEDFYGELRWITTVRGYAPGWAAHKFRERFGVWPNDWQVRLATPREPTLKMKNWLRSRAIASPRGGRLMGRKRRDSEGRYVQLHHYMLDSPAYRGLTTQARAVYVEIAKRYNGVNNGRIALSVRDAEAACNIARNTASRAFRELIDAGFIEETRHGGLSRKTRIASEWRLTAYKCDLTGSLKSCLFLRRGGRRTLLNDGGIPT
jgi:DNA-binding transcriptional regulator YhcF (GntR family)